MRLASFFEDKSLFKEAELEDGCRFSFYSVDLIWKEEPEKLELRFVLTIDEQGRESIFYTTDLTLDPVEVVSLYKLRFNIEQTYKDLGREVHGQAYGF